ncbi:type II toxin-antitoxin system VapB family antitoxin [Microbacterium sp.]|uniref:type II toxin-antitoxin system VapB family antitoxin n=1 Tax=Microbacterium sp. TaxID=51671 RepID=UPI0039E34810
MALNIKDPETDRIARELAAATGESITVAARIALEQRLRRVRARAEEHAVRDELEAIIARGQRRHVIDDSSAETIIGYDEHGLPA